MKQAIVYDRVNKIGGAEKVLSVLHEMFPSSPLYTAVYNPEKALWAKSWDVRPSFLNRFPLASSIHELYPWATPLAFESLDFGDYDIVVSVTSAEAKGILTKPTTLHVCYCLTPTRYLWQDYELYQKQFPSIVKPLLSPVFSHLRNWDEIASMRPDAYIAISETVRKRIQLFYQRDAQVIFPPVDVDIFQKPSGARQNLPFNEFYLVVSRIVPYKRVELAVRAANRLRRNLLVIGKGMKLKSLQKISGPTVRWCGELTEAELVVYYQQCKALIFPQEEDFGISIVEAQAAGKPVIAYNKGGATEIIRTGKTGIFFASQTTESLVKALLRFERMHFAESICKKNAMRFRKQNFIEKFSSALQHLWIKNKNKNEL